MNDFKIPFFGSQREFIAHEDAFLEAVKKTYLTGQYLQGLAVETLESRMAQMCGRHYGVAVGSCTDALYLALVAAGIRPGDEVLVTDFSFVASASCIARAGAVPIFVDIGNDYNMDFAKAEVRISKKSKALILVHLYGQMNDPEVAEAFCRKHGLLLIEDNAQAISSKWGPRSSGSLGLASCLSFDPTKPLGAPGSGGMLLTDEEEIAKRVRRLRYHGREGTSFVEPGLNSQMPTATAAILLYKLTHNETWLKRRRAMAAQYRKGLTGFAPVQLPAENYPNSHNYHKFVIRSAAREKIRQALTEASIETFVHYAVPLHRQPAFGKSSEEDRLCPKALAASREVFSLPIHPFLTDDEVDLIIHTVRSSL